MATAKDTHDTAPDLHLPPRIPTGLAAAARSLALACLVLLSLPLLVPLSAAGDAPSAVPTDGAAGADEVKITWGTEDPPDDWQTPPPGMWGGCTVLEAGPWFCVHSESGIPPLPPLPPLPPVAYGLPLTIYAADTDDRTHLP